MAVQQIGLSDEMGECMDACIEAAEVGEWCANKYVGHGEEMARCLRLCRDVVNLASLYARLCTHWFRGKTPRLPRPAQRSYRSARSPAETWRKPYEILMVGGDRGQFCPYPVLS